jgi:outer membrane protein OmpA-like peptidoglycan-associated protein
MNGTWRAQGFAAWAGRGFRLVALASLLGGCSMFDSKPSPGEAATAGQPYPNLGTVPTQAPPTTSSADRAQVTQGLVADQQNAAYSADQLKAQPGAGAVPPPAPATPPTGTETAAAPTAPASSTPSATPAPAAAATSSATPPASTTIPAPGAVEQSTLPPPPNMATQTAATTAPATVPYGTPMPAPAAQPAAAAAEPHYASPYYPIPVAGAPAPYAPAAVPGQTQLAQAQIPPAAGAPVIQDQARLAAILGAGAATIPGQPTAPAAAVQQPPIAVIFFRNGSVGLSSRDYSVLHDVVLLQQQQGGRLRVVGHASERTETTDYATHQAINDNLSLKRASAVGGALLQMGAPGSAVAISAVGGQGPIFYEFMPTGEAGNRRVEIFLDR